MPARRCTICSINWPQEDIYKICPLCEEKTRKGSNIRAIGKKKAKSLKAHADFEKFYLEKHQDKPLPELSHWYSEDEIERLCMPASSGIDTIV